MPLPSLPFELKPVLAAPVREGELRRGEALECARVRGQSPRIDFAIACRLAEIGQGDSVIEAVLREVGRDTPVGASHIERTLAAARRRMEVWEETPDGANGAGCEEGAHVGGG